MNRFRIEPDPDGDQKKTKVFVEREGEEDVELSTNCQIVHKRAGSPLVYVTLVGNCNLPREEGFLAQARPE